ncbi:MAG: galactosyldiacylglycerol synthase [Gemmatimonadaceae bacterium]
MPTLRDKEADRLLGHISDDDLQFLIDQLEETSDSDTDYWIDTNTVQLLEDEGGSAELIGLLRAALSGRDGFEMEWARD